MQHALALEYGLPDCNAVIAALDDMAFDRQQHAERVETVLRHGRAVDDARTPLAAVRFPDVRKDNVFVAAACGAVDDVRRFLAHDAAATSTGCATSGIQRV